MPVIVQDEIFDILPSPAWGSPRTRKAPKVKFQAQAGYVHQRERWPSARSAWQLKWPLLTTAELNTLENWLDNTKSNSFYMLPPTGMWGNTTNPGIRLVRVVSEETVITPLSYGYFSVDITVEDV